MIKKSVFEDEIVANMQQELKPMQKTAAAEVANAIDYLNNAAEIFEEAGLSVQADKVVAILSKIADSKIEKLPAIQTLIDAGVSEEDFAEFGKGSMFAKAKINKALKDAGYSHHEIGTFIGKHNVLNDSEINELLGPQSSLNKILKMIQDPNAVIPGKAPNPGEEIGISSIASYKKPNDPRRVSDPHTKGLTPDKMVKNLLHHGTEFNMADDGAADDLLNLEINDEGLEVSEKEPNSEMDFEDEI